MTKQTLPIESADFKEAVELLSIYSTVEHQLAELEAVLNKKILAETDEIKANYALMQATMQEASDKLEVISLRHPEWFTGKKSVKTPFGELKFHKSSPLEVKNEDLTIALIEAEIAILREKINAVKKTSEADPLIARHNSLFTLIRHKKELNIEAMENCDAATLEKFRVTRVEKQNFSIKAAKVDLGKAVQASNKLAEAA